MLVYTRDETDDTVLPYLCCLLDTEIEVELATIA